jgi:hypothetical protein
MSPENVVANELQGELTDGQYVDKILETLKGLPQKRSQNILKMVGIVHNVRFVPAFAMPLGPNRPPPGRDTRGQVKARVPPKANPAVKLIRSEINELNAKISKKSLDLGRVKLPEEDELIVKRNQLFRDLKEAQNKIPQSAKGATEEESQRAQARNARGGPQSGPPAHGF